MNAALRPGRSERSLTTKVSSTGRGRGRTPRQGGKGRWLSVHCLTLLALTAVPSPGSAAEIVDERDAAPPSVFLELGSRMRELPPFLRDSELTLHLRTFYQNVQTGPGQYKEAWAGGGWLAYQSGWLLDTLSVGAAGYTSLPLYAPASREGTLLLEPDGQSLAVLGQAWAKLKWDDHVLTGYRQLVDLGYVNRYDSRMIPNTFEGVMLAGTFDWFEYTAGYLARMKARDEDEFSSMSAAAGAGRTHEGAALAGFRLQPRKPFWMEANTVFGLDTFNTALVRAGYTHALGEDVSLSLGAQYTDQRTAGSQLLGSFQTWTVGFRVALAFFGASIAPAFHRTGSGNDVQTPYGRWPGYLHMITKDFDRARETALGLETTYDFGYIGAQGLNGRFSFASGIDAVNPSTKKAAPDRREYDFDVIYAPPVRWLQGFSFRVRVGLVEQAGISGLLPDIRLITNYEIPVLGGGSARRLAPGGSGSE